MRVRKVMAYVLEKVADAAADADGGTDAHGDQHRRASAAPAVEISCNNQVDDDGGVVVMGMRMVVVV